MSLAATYQISVKISVKSAYWSIKASHQVPHSQPVRSSANNPSLKAGRSLTVGWQVPIGGCILAESFLVINSQLCPRREEILAQSKVGGIAAKTSFDQLFVQYKCTVMDEINGHYLQLL